MTARLTPTEIEAIRTRVAEHKPPRSNWMGDLDAAQLYDAVDDRAALLADRDATLAGAWRPIAEYNPIRDGDVLLCRAGDLLHRVGCWDDEPGKRIGYQWCVGETDFVATDWPTHFQALPAPPSPKETT